MIKKFNEFLNENKSLSNNKWILDQINNTTPYVEDGYDDYDDMKSYWIKDNKVLFECGEDYVNEDGTILITIESNFWNKIKELGYTDQEVKTILIDIFNEKFENATVSIIKGLIDKIDISTLEERDEDDVFKWVYEPDDDKLQGQSKEEFEQYLLNGKINIDKYISMFGTSNKDVLRKYFTKNYKGFKGYVFNLKKYGLGDPDVKFLISDVGNDFISFNEFRKLLQKYNLKFPTEQLNNYYEEKTKEYQNGKIKLEKYCKICVNLGFKTPPKEEIKKLFLEGKFDFETYLFMCKWRGFDTYPTKDELKKMCLEKPGDDYTLRKNIMRFKLDVTKEEKYNYYKKNFFEGRINYQDFMNYQIVKMFIDDETKDAAYSFYKKKE